MTPWWPARLLLALSSGLALALAFPSYNFPLLAWVAVAGLLVMRHYEGFVKKGRMRGRRYA